MRIIFVLASFVIFSAAPVHAAPDEAAFRLFVSGEYEAAADRAAETGGAENLALAARALNARAYLEADDKSARRIAKRALNHAEDALAADDALVEAHLQAAISLAQRGARMAALRAFFLGVAGRARDELGEALRRDPNNPWALSSSAAWHLEVARRVGEGRFGSDPALGRQQFIAARAAAPDNLLIAYECALRLLASDRPEWRSEGLAALDAADAIAPADAFETAIKARATHFRAAIESGREAERAFIDAHP